MGVFKKRAQPGPYKTGETVPRSGIVKCTEYFGTRAKVREGTKFGRCLSWNDRLHGIDCRWRYVEAAETIWVGLRSGYIPSRVSGAVELWGGWHLELPNECLAEWHADGSWLAWDVAHVVDVHIGRPSRKRNVRPPAPPLLDRESNTSGSGWVGYVEDGSDSDDDGPLHRIDLFATAHASFLACSISYREPEARAWAETLLSTITFVPRR